MNTCINTFFIRFIFENQFGYPTTEGCELIFPAPFRAGVNRKNQFAILIKEQTINISYT